MNQEMCLEMSFDVARLLEYLRAKFFARLFLLNLHDESEFALII